jgi:hypothetical protein
MAAPTTRSDLKTRTAAVIVELGELVAGAHNLSLGADGGTQVQKDAAGALKVRLRECHKSLSHAGVGGVSSQVT